MQAQERAAMAMMVAVPLAEATSKVKVMQKVMEMETGTLKGIYKD